MALLAPAAVFLFEDLSVSAYAGVMAQFQADVALQLEVTKILSVDSYQSGLVRSWLFNNGAYPVQWFSDVQVMQRPLANASLPTSCRLPAQAQSSSQASERRARWRSSLPGCQALFLVQQADPFDEEQPGAPAARVEDVKGQRLQNDRVQGTHIML